jgi:hypothetical protein
MKNKELKRYKYLRAKIRRLEREIQESDASPEYCGAVLASSPEPPYNQHNITIMDNSGINERRRAELARALLERDRIFNFIKKIENDEMRELALRFYINGESWEEIAQANGQPGHAASYRVQLHRYLKRFINQT